MPCLINDGFPFLARDCRRLGLSPHEFRRARRERHLRTVFKNVYVDAAVPDSRWLRVVSTRLVTPPHAIVCDSFAAWLLGVDTFRPSDRHTLLPTLVVPHGASRVTFPGVRCRQAILPPRDIIEIEGINLSNPLRTTSDLLRKQWRPYALAAADAMAHAGYVHPDEVVDYVARLKGFRGAPQARSLAAMIEPLTASPGESWQRLRIIDAGFPRPSAQVRVTLSDGSERYLDLAYPELLIASEFDGAEFHTLDQDRAHDKERRALLSRVKGWRFVLGDRSRIFGKDEDFERELGALLGLEPLPRIW